MTLTLFILGYLAVSLGVVCLFGYIVHAINQELNRNDGTESKELEPED